MNNPIKIVLIDDNVMIRSGIKLLLTQNLNFQMMSEVGLADGFVVMDYDPDIIILRLEPKESPKIIALISQLHRAYPSVQKLILANSCDDPMLIEALKAGVKGCLLKESSMQDFEKAIQELAIGNVFIPSSISGKLIQRLINPIDWDPLNSAIILSSQQMKVLKLISEGNSSEEIAKALVISKRTVDMHIYKMFRRLKVSSRTQAIQVASRIGLIDLSHPVEEM